MYCMFKTFALYMCTVTIHGVIHCRALAAFVTYFIVGAVFLRVKHQKSGTDLIIHKEFWKDFPFLIKVHVHALCMKIHVKYVCDPLTACLHKPIIYMFAM